MVDFYGLPQDQGREWPGRRASGVHAIGSRATFVETQMASDVRAILDTERFIPFVVMHEFEASLFSDCAAFSRGIHRPDIAEPMNAIRQEFASPEEIDDSPDKAPSKRILALEPRYRKPIMGTLAALEIGLEKCAPTARTSTAGSRGWNG